MFAPLRVLATANRLARQFRPRARHQAWTMDITYISTDEGWLYLAVVEDLFSRKIVGWATSERIDSELVAVALNMALGQERPEAGLLAHSDRGVQYASDRFQGLLAQHGIVCSMSRKANCWDNAPTESLSRSPNTWPFRKYLQNDGTTFRLRTFPKM